MGFADRYVHALGASSLRDDELHCQTEPLAAAALADRSARDIGSLLHRVKHSGTIGAKLHKAATEYDRLEKLLGEAQRKKSEIDSKVASIASALESCVSGHTGAGGEINEFRSLRRSWLEIVTQKGRDRHWIKQNDWPALGHLFPRMAERIAIASLAHYLDSTCKSCDGTGGTGDPALRVICKCCNGSGRAVIVSSPEQKMSDYEINLAYQMADELLSLEQTHAGVANAKLRLPV